MHRSLSRLVGLLALVGGCTFGTDDPPPPVAPPCGDAAAICADDCCTRIESPVYPDGCTPACEGGLRLIGGFACDPLPACGWTSDGGVDAPMDACRPGPAPAACRRGPCCDDVVDGVVDPVTCALECPRGFVAEALCVPEPSCVAATPCAQPSDCTLAATTCCGTCETPTLDDVIGVHRSDVADYEEALCRVPEECPPCVVGDPNPNLVATCNATECRAVDVRRTPLASCVRDEDCRLRTNTCCECDVAPGPTTVVAIGQGALADFLGLVCDDDAVCDACAVEYPSNLEAFCDEGLCAVRELP